MSAEPGTTAEQMNQLNATLASSHRFVNAEMALEAGWRHMPPSRVRAEFRVFAEDVEKTLFILAKMLQGARARTKDIPDLREDQQRLIQSAVAPPRQYALVDVEADRIANSLNTLREQVTEWVRAERDG